MGIVHIPRTAAATFRGLTKRRLSPLSDREKSLVGIGTRHPPHVYSSRAGLFDVDLMFHMNNASYLTHAELARWEWSAFGGVLTECLRTKSWFIVTASMIRFRREIAPMKKFEIETRLGGLDDRNLWVYQTFHHSKNSNERGKVLAQVLTQAVIVRDKQVINPRSWIEDTVPAAKDNLDSLTTSSGEVESLFDEKSTRFMHLEDSLRRSAAIHDDQVKK
ncbi:hypothetical protein ACHAXR_002783 [Thalassiosira sp. AJA248-18]